MQAQKDGAIINISTAWDFGLGRDSAVFSPPQIFADTYAADNVRMNSVLRGWIDNAGHRRAAEEGQGRYGRADEGRGHISLLASNSTYITRQTAALIAP